MPTINSKYQFYKLYYAGALGNKLRNWRSLRDLKESGFIGQVVSRYHIPNMPYTKYNIYMDELDNVIEFFCKNGAEKDLFNFNEAAPDDRLILQGEVYYGIGGLYLTYSKVKLPMRAALSEASMHVQRTLANQVLRASMDASSFDDLMILFENYPDAVVEFGAYEMCLGDIPERNTVIWEVRNY